MAWARPVRAKIAASRDIATEGISREGGEGSEGREGQLPSRRPSLPSLPSPPSREPLQWFPAAARPRRGRPETALNAKLPEVRWPGRRDPAFALAGDAGQSAAPARAKAASRRRRTPRRYRAIHRYAPRAASWTAVVLYRFWNRQRVAARNQLGPRGAARARGQSARGLAQSRTLPRTPRAIPTATPNGGARDAPAREPARPFQTIPCRPP